MVLQNIMEESLRGVLQRQDKGYAGSGAVILPADYPVLAGLPVKKFRHSCPTLSALFGRIELVHFTDRHKKP